MGAITNGSELNKLYNAAKIYLHISSTSVMDQSLLDAIASGVFVMVRANPDDRRGEGIGKFFALDRELVTFEGPKDLIRKVRHYLKNDQERQRIAEAAREKLLAQHSCRVRLVEMLDIIKAHLNHMPQSGADS